MSASAYNNDSSLNYFKPIFEQVVESYYTSLYRFAYSLAKNEHEAFDLTQQTYYVYAQKGYTVKETSKIKAWLFTTLYREFLRLKRRAARMTDEDPETLEEISPTIEPEVLKKMDATEAMQALQAVEKIYRIPLTLFYLDSNSYHEIADILDIPVGTVMSRISRGRNLLKKALFQKTVPASP